MRRPILWRYGRIATLVGILLTAGCGGGGGDGDGDGDDGVGPDVPGDPDAGPQAADALAAELDAIIQNVLLPGGPPGCVTIDPLPMVDSDHDGVPDDLRFSFDLNGCRYTVDEPGAWGSTSGAVRVTDPGAAFGFDAVLEEYAVWAHLTDSTPPRDIVRSHSGETHVSGSEAAVAFSTDQTVFVDITGQPDAALAIEWSGTFVPSGPEPFRFYVLNPGSLTMTGTGSFSRNQTTIRFSLTTTTPLSWEASCPSIWPQSGVVRANVLSGATAGYLEISYTACFQRGEVEFVPT
jgi:hypothetical protein